MIPPLHWTNAGTKRVLYAGNLPDPVAWGEAQSGVWKFHVALPGSKFEPRRHASRSAAEAFIAGVCEAWFKAVFA